MKKGIVVSGVGEVRAAPDILAVTIEVETRASTVAAARTANAGGRRETNRLAQGRGR